MSTYPLPQSAHDMQMTLVTNSKIFTDPFTGAIQSAARNGARWRLNFNFINKSGLARRELQAFKVKLNGQEHRVQTKDHSYSGALGTPTGTPLVNGGSQTGTTLITDGWSNLTNIFKTGDQFQIGNELKMITADVTSSGTGEATIAFMPPLRSSPANNAPIIVTDPQGVFILEGTEHGWGTAVSGHSNFGFSLIEDVLA